MESCDTHVGNTYNAGSAILHATVTAKSNIQETNVETFLNHIAIGGILNGDPRSLGASIVCLIHGQQCGIVPLSTSSLVAQVCSQLHSMVSERSVWYLALQDIWQAKPRAYRPAICSLSSSELRVRTVFEARLQERLTSQSVPQCTWKMETISDIVHAQFIPNSNGKFITCTKGGDLQLHAAGGDVLGGAEEFETEETVGYMSFLWIRPVSQHTCLGIQLHQSELSVHCLRASLFLNRLYYSCSNYGRPGIIRLLRIEDKITVLATITTKTRPISADVTRNRLAFVCHGLDQLNSLELQVHSLDHPADRRVFQLSGFGKYVSHPTMLVTTLTLRSMSTIILLLEAPWFSLITIIFYTSTKRGSRHMSYLRSL